MGRLDLTYNRLVHVKRSWFAVLTSFLVSLALSSNQITRMEPRCFTGLWNLHYLYLNDNLLRNVDPDWFTGLNKLNELNLELNCIEVIDAGTFEHLTQLYRLTLAGNSLSHLDGGTFWGLNSLIVLGKIGARSAHDLEWSLALGNSDDFYKGQDVSVKIDQCRQAWGAAGLTVALYGWLNLRLVSFWEENEEKETLAIVFDQTIDCVARTTGCVTRTTDYVVRTTNNVLRTTDHVVMATDPVLRTADDDRTTDRIDIDDIFTGQYYPE
ncbi:PREDICTED: uncharacterized protein LOC109474703 [Branchiostoma belcheri]|uniref:Uncharacterized protein LOC109474703 n=1 Tax=Branchiostoma belcheri TaxID=7741 RepID=A0A6P4Z9I9_BRABE|nr:PREDICTED: uncharacterized protein LOC109474703 [Branchiostoma belcheri]